jgi:salicylate hydroxylase
MASRDDTFHVAIIGAGITGVNLALGLQARNVPFTLYERAPCFRDIGAGIGFSPNAERAMPLLNPDILTSFKRVANPNGKDYFQWVDGFDSGELIFKLHVGKDGFQGGRRSDILEEWGKLIDPTSVLFSKVLSSITEPESKSDKLLLHFNDGTTATADAVIGCDGIRSLVRKHILAPRPLPCRPSELPPSATPRYTQKFCFRALAPMSTAIAAIGSTKALTRYMYNGPGAHVITYPVANNTLLNILAVISDSSPTWPHQFSTAPGHKSEAVEAFKDWHPTVRAIIDLLPDEMDKWGIFDMAEHPALYYAKGRVCVAGDAAHAAGPHLGAGGGMGVEDALVLAGLLAEVDRRVREPVEGGRSKGELVAKALEAYNEARYRRTQHVVKETREACDLFQWRDPAVARSPDTYGPAISAMFHKIWDYDVEGMAKEAVARLGEGEI